MEGLGLYIHIPFCKSKCYYCDFNSYSGKEDIQDRYVDCLISEINMRSSILKKYKIKSIYIGGGTPTYLNLKTLSKLLGFLKQFSGPGVEYSCEANPGTLSCEKLTVLKENAVNRLSIGLQSWDDNILKRLGRIHNVDDFLENYHLARKLGFHNINVDLMSSIEGQDTEILGSTLDNVISLKPEHISCYGLIIEEGTVFGEKYKAGLMKEIDEDLDREMYYLATAKLETTGYMRYEISNYAIPGFECSHNIIYWKTMPYLGIGAGAHSYIGGTRFFNEYLPEKYIDRIKHQELPTAGREELTLDEKISELMFMGLRMTEGVSMDDFKNRFNIELLQLYKDEIRSLSDKGLIYIKNNRLVLTDKGIDLSNRVFVEFMR